MSSNAATTLAGERSRSDSRAQTRQRLLEVGRQAFARKGHAGTNLKDDILVPAGVSVGSFYHQFRDKTDLFLDILQVHSETFRTMVRETHTLTGAVEPADVARHSFHTVFRMAEQNDDLFRIMARERESHDTRVRTYLRRNHREWIASLAEDYRRLGFIQPGDRATAELVAELVSALTAGTVLLYLDHPLTERRRIRARLIEGLVQMTLGGVPALVAAAVPLRGPAHRLKRRKGAP